MATEGMADGMVEGDGVSEGGKKRERLTSGVDGCWRVAGLNSVQGGGAATDSVGCTMYTRVAMMAPNLSAAACVPTSIAAHSAVLASCRMHAQLRDESQPKSEVAK